MRLSGWRRAGSTALAGLFLCAAGGRAVADDFYSCRDSGGVPETIRVDVAHKRVLLITGQPPQHCVMEFDDGAVEPLYRTGPGYLCIVAALADPGERVHKFMAVSGGEITFGATGQGGTQKFVLDTRRGVLEYAEGPDECHRAKG